MYCMNCGHEIAGNARFCMCYGTETARGAVADVASRTECGIYVGSNEGKRLEIRELQRARNYFGGKKEVYEQLHRSENALKDEEENHLYRFFMTGNEDSTYYAAARFCYAENFMHSREITFHIRNLKEVYYTRLIFRLANDAVSLQIFHGTWANVILRDRLEIAPFIVRPLIVCGNLTSE